MLTNPEITSPMGAIRCFSALSKGSCKRDIASAMVLR